VPENSRKTLLELFDFTPDLLDSGGILYGGSEILKLNRQLLLKVRADTDQRKSEEALAKAQFLKEELNAGWAAFAKDRSHDR